MDNSKELQETIERLRKELVDIVQNRSFKMDSGVQVAHRQAEIFVCASQLTEISSRRLERLTRHIIYLTWTLVVFTIGLFILTFVLVKHG